MWVSDIDSRINIANYHNDVRTDIIRPRSLHNFIDKHLVGCGDSTHRCRASGTESLILPTVGTALAAVRYRRSRYKVIAIVIY